MNPAWLFVLAAVIAAFGIFSNFKKLMILVQRKIEENDHVHQSDFQKEQTQFFLRTVMVEAIPLVLIVLGFIQLEKFEGSTINIILPLFIVVAVMIAVLLEVFLIRSETLRSGEGKEIANVVNTFTFLGISLICAIPIISIIAISLILS